MIVFVTMMVIVIGAVEGWSYATARLSAETVQNTVASPLADSSPELETSELMIGNRALMPDWTLDMARNIGIDMATAEGNSRLLRRDRWWTGWGTACRPVRGADRVFIFLGLPDRSHMSRLRSKY